MHPYDSPFRFARVVPIILSPYSLLRAREIILKGLGPLEPSSIVFLVAEFICTEKCKGSSYPNNHSATKWSLTSHCVRVS